MTPRFRPAGVRADRSPDREIDTRLNRRHDVTRTWPDLPPREVLELLQADLPREWSLLA